MMLSSFETLQRASEFASKASQNSMPGCVKRPNGISSGRVPLEAPQLPALTDWLIGPLDLKSTTELLPGELIALDGRTFGALEVLWTGAPPIAAEVLPVREKSSQAVFTVLAGSDEACSD